MNCKYSYKSIKIYKRHCEYSKEIRRFDCKLKWKWIFKTLAAKEYLRGKSWN